MQEHSLCSMLLIQMIQIVSSVGGLCPIPLSHESSALITRPRLLWLGKCFFLSFLLILAQIKIKIENPKNIVFFSAYVLRVCSAIEHVRVPNTGDAIAFKESDPEREARHERVNGDLHFFYSNNICKRVKNTGGGGGVLNCFLIPGGGVKAFRKKITRGVPYFGFYFIFINKFFENLSGGDV
jgi:hypothetical protein